MKVILGTTTAALTFLSPLPTMQRVNLLRKGNGMSHDDKRYPVSGHGTQLNYANSSINLLAFAIALQDALQTGFRLSVPQFWPPCLWLNRKGALRACT